MRRFFSYVLPFKKRVAAALLAMIASAGASSLMVLLLGQLTDAGFYEKDPRIVIAAPLGLVLIAGLNGLGMLASNVLLAGVSQSVMMRFRAEMFSRFMHWPEDAYQRNATGLILSKFVNEANFALSNATKSSIVLVRDSVQVVALTAVLFWHNVVLTLVTLLVAPAIVWLLRTISRRVRAVMEGSQESVATLLVRVKETYEAERLVKISLTHDYEARRFRKVNDGIRDLALRMAKAGSLGEPATQAIAMTGVALVLAIALWQTQAGLFTLGEFVTFLVAMLLLTPPLRRLASLNTTDVGMTVAAESIFSTLDERLEEDAGTLSPEKIEGDIRFEGVTLRYPNADRDAVRDFTLTIRKGERTALVGLGKNVGRQHAHPLLESDGRTHHDRRDRHEGHPPGCASPPDRGGLPKDGALRRHRAGQSHVRAEQCLGRTNQRGARRGGTLGLRRVAPGRLEHPGGRGRRPAFGRTETEVVELAMP